MFGGHPECPYRECSRLHVPMILLIESLGVPAPESFSNDLLALDNCRFLSGFRNCLPCAKFIYKQILRSLYLALLSTGNF